MLWWVILLFLGGMALIIAEFMLPGAILGIFGGLLLIASTGLGLYAYPEHGVLIVLSEILGAAVVSVLGVYFVSRTSFGGGLMLRTSQRVEEGYVNLPNDGGLLGQVGVVTTLLRPAGTIEVRGERMDAVANGVYIPAGARVRILEVHGNRVVVEQVETADTSPSA